MRGSGVASGGAGGSENVCIYLTERKQGLGWGETLEREDQFSSLAYLHDI